MKTFATLIALAICTWCTSANGDIVVGESILLDFGNQQAVGGVSPPTNSNFINNAPLIPRTTLTEFSTGSTVNVGLTLESGDGTPVNFFNDDSGDIGSPNGNTGTPGFVIPAPFNSAITEDWSGVVNGDSYDITFTGLDDSLSYNIDYIVGGFTNNTVTNGMTLTADGQSAALGVISNDPKTASFTGLSTDGSGNLLIQIVEPGGAGTEVPVISGLYLTAVATVPEPSSTALLLLAGFGFAIRRVRK